jgi:hypothetical protein
MLPVRCRLVDIPRVDAPLLPARPLLGILLPLLPGPVLGRSNSDTADVDGTGDAARDNATEAILEDVTETDRLAGLYDDARAAAS